MLKNNENELLKALNAQTDISGIFFVKKMKR
jgi:hypothetical protein